MALSPCYFRCIEKMPVSPDPTGTTLGPANKGEKGEREPRESQASAFDEIPVRESVSAWTLRAARIFPERKDASLCESRDTPREISLVR